MSYIQSLKKSAGFTPKCQFDGCTRDADSVHHVRATSDGGTDDDANRRPLCFYHHHMTHANQGDWSRWGRNGGRKTAAEPLNFKRNLRQFKNWTDERFAAYVLERQQKQQQELSSWA